MSSRSTMGTQTDGTGNSRSFELRCVDCSFERIVEGDIFDVLDTIDVHQDEYVNDAFEHFVEFEVEGSGVLANGDPD